MRILIVAAALLLAACQHDARYFGNTTPPAGQRLVYLNCSEPATLDPAIQASVFDSNILQALYEGLVLINPVTQEPMAGAATHYELSADGKEYTFYLRGHRDPKGTRLPDIESLPREFSHGAHAPPDSAPAYWSDGSVVTASDFVYSWQRYADPRMASPQVPDLMVVLNVRESVAGKMKPDQIGAQALDDFTLRVKLVDPTPYFLQLIVNYYPVPRRAIERARQRGREDSWTRPGNIVTNGPFALAEWRPYDCLRATRNPHYYERDLVQFNEVLFLPINAGAAAVNLYRGGVVQSMYPDALPPGLIPSLKTTRDFRNDPALSPGFLTVSYRKPPFDNQLLRWAVNMALDKRAIADFFVAEPAQQLVPPMPGYTPPQSIMVEVKGKKYDVLAHDLAGARELLAAAGYPGGIGADGKSLTFPINMSGGNVVEIAEIIRHQLFTGLKVDARVTPMEFNILDSGQRAGTLRGLSIFGYVSGYADPYAFLGPNFMSWVGWHDKDYDAALKDAMQTLDPRIRMAKLARCEAIMMKAMAVIPYFFQPNIYLAKPYVRAFKIDLLGNISFRYAWFDPKWSGHNFKEGDQP